MTAAELVPKGAAALERLDPAAREAAVTSYLSHARDQLAVAVQMTGPAAVAALKAEIATAAEATKQLGLSKEIQTDAQEMVRRAEYALGKAIRAGQERGLIRKTGEITCARGGFNEAPVETRNFAKASPTDYAAGHELSNTSGGIYDLVDDVAEPQFEAALSDARGEGNLSRANVIRKIQDVKQDSLTPVEKLTKIRELAPTGRTSGQIAVEIGGSESYVRRTARANGIEITADKVLAGTHRVRVDHNHIVNHAVMTLDGLASGLDRIDYDGLDDTQLQDWADSLTDSLRVLNRFATKIKEMAQ